MTRVTQCGLFRLGGERRQGDVKNVTNHAEKATCTCGSDRDTACTFGHGTVRKNIFWNSPLEKPDH